MKWFKPRHSVCSICEVHFEPVTGYEARWGNLCSLHRKPIRERDEKKDAVMAWASINWEELVERVEKERKETITRFNESINWVDYCKAAASPVAVELIDTGAAQNNTQGPHFGGLSNSLP